MKRNPHGIRIALMALVCLLLVSGCATTTRRTSSIMDLLQSDDPSAIDSFFANLDQINKPIDDERFKEYKGLYPLHVAVMRNQLGNVSKFLYRGADPNVKDPTGKTPLRYAVDRQKFEMVEILCARGADPFLPDAAGVTPARVALEKGSDMVDAMFNSRNLNESGPDGRTILHLAADALQEKVVRMLLDKGASVQKQDKALKTPLDTVLLYPDRIEAARIAEMLIQKGANPSYPEFAWFAQAVRATDYQSARFENGNTALHEATRRYQYGFAQFMLDQGIKPDSRNAAGETPLHSAVKSGWIAGAQLLLDRGANPNARDSQDNTPLHMNMPAPARLQMISLLLSRKADPALKDSHGNTVLHKAVLNSYEPPVVEALLAAQSPVDAQNNDDDTPLILAVRLRRLEYVPLLLAAKANILKRNRAGESALSLSITRGYEAVDSIVQPSNVMQTDEEGSSVLMVAVSQQASPAIVRLILSKGADVNTTNKVGDSALHLAVRNRLKEQALILIEAKADIFRYNAALENPLFLALSATPAPLDWFFTPQVLAARDDKGETVMHHAARKNLPEGITYLAQKGATLDARNIMLETPLHIAARSDAVEAGERLIQSGAPLSAADVNGDTPLHAAVNAGALKSAQLFIRLKAPLDIQNYAGETALHIAARRNAAGIVNTLCANNARVDVADAKGMTALAAAAAAGSLESAQALLAVGSAIDTRDTTGSTPLLRAVESEHAGLIRLLIQKNADIFALNARKVRPFTLAMQKNALIQREFLDPALVGRTDSNGDGMLHVLILALASPEQLEAALKAGAGLETRNSQGTTPLAFALTRLKDGVSPDTVLLLIRNGASPFAANADNETPLGIIFGLQPTQRRAFLKALLDKGTVDYLGDTVLHHAVRMGREDMVRELLELGADPAVRNRKGETAGDIARSRGLSALATLLGAK